MNFKTMLTDGGSKPDKLTLSHGWLRERNEYLTAQWDSYSELMILEVLGLGSPTNPMSSKTWHAWDHGPKAMSNPDLSLFTHQYSNLFLDLKGLKDGEGVDYFRTAQQASLADRSFSQKNERGGLWGITATDTPDGGYLAYSQSSFDGTFSPGCALASIEFIPELVSDDVKRWSENAMIPMGDYGFPESINLEKRWVDSDVLAITLGPAYLAMKNWEDGSVWKTFAKIPAIQNGLHVASFH